MERCIFWIAQSQMCFSQCIKRILKISATFPLKVKKRNLNMDRTKNESEFARFHQQSMENDGKSGFDEDLQR